MVYVSVRRGKAILPIRLPPSNGHHQASPESCPSLRVEDKVPDVLVSKDNKWSQKDHEDRLRNLSPTAKHLEFRFNG